MGKPKAELRLPDGTPILAWLLDRFAWKGPTVLVTAPGRENPPGHERFTAQPVDPSSGKGPLRGVLTALEYAVTPMTVVVPVDMPNITIRELEWLIAALRERDDLVGLMPVKLIERRPLVEPFPCAFTVDARRIVAEHFADGATSVHSLAKLPQFAAILVPFAWPDSIWININRPEDWEAFLSERDREFTTESTEDTENTGESRIEDRG